MLRSFRQCALLMIAPAMLLAACGAATPPSSPSPSPSPSSAPSPSPAAAVVVTFQVEDEQYRIMLTDPVDIDNARRLLAGEAAPSIPSGLIVRGDPGVNTGYSWHIDPESVEFADMTMEVCDGVPSFVEDGTLEGDRYCPWGARVVSIDAAGQ